MIMADTDLINSLMAGLGPGGNAPSTPTPLQPNDQATQAANDPALQSSNQSVNQTLAALMANSGQNPPMAQGGVPASGGSQVPTPGIGGLPSLIMNLLNPARGVQAGQPIPSKAARFEDFVGNMLTSLSAGFSQEGHGPGSFGRGFGAAVQAPYQQALQTHQLQEQQKQQEAALQIERQKAESLRPSISVTGPNGEQVNISPSQLPQYFAAGYRFKGAQAGAESRVKSAEIGAQSRIDVEKLKLQVAQGQASKFIPDQDPNGNSFYHVYNKYGKEIGRADVNVIPQLMTKTSSSVEYKQQEDGSYIALPKTTTTGPVVPNRGGANGSVGVMSAGTPKSQGGRQLWATSAQTGNGLRAVPVLNADGTPLFGKAPENIRTMAYTANATLPHMDDILSEIDQLDKLGLLGEFKGKGTAFLTNKGFAIPGLTQDQRQLVGKFANDVKLMDSAMLRTHFGARGGQNMYDKFSEMLNAGEHPDLMRGGIESFKDYLTGYRDMVSQSTRQAAAAQTKPANNSAAPAKNATPSQQKQGGPKLNADGFPIIGG